VLEIILHWVVSSLALALTAAVVPGFRLRGFTTALMATFIIGALNYTIYPIMFFFALPLTIVTLGLFLFVLDAIVLRVCAAFMKDFDISGWLSALIGALILAVTNSFLHYMLV
jgi:putative membrane protein